MIFLYIIWLLFAAVFLYLAYATWQQSQDDLRPFSLRERDREISLPKTGEGDQTGEAFVAEFNSYLEKINSQNRKRLQASAVAYFIAGIISIINLIPMFLT